MTIEKAKQILAGYGQNLTNEQIVAIMECFDTLIEIGFQQFEKRHSEKKEKEACNGSRTVQ